MVPTVDIGASLDVLEHDTHVHYPSGMLKFPDDLDRYAHLIATTGVDLVVETGTRTLGSARWFADHGVHVVTVDHAPVPILAEYADRITQVVGDSTAPAVVAEAARLAEGHRVLVSLDSDHAAAHVAREIAVYGPLVTPGCHLVVEDTIFGYAPMSARRRHIVGLNGVGTPLDVLGILAADDRWVWDVEVEAMRPTSGNPGGWWRRVDRCAATAAPPATLTA